MTLQALRRTCRPSSAGPKMNCSPPNRTASRATTMAAHSLRGMFSRHLDCIRRFPVSPDSLSAAPLFPKATIHLENGKTIQILARQSSPENYYIQSLQLNGHDYQSPWIEWSALKKGATMDFNLGDKPS